MTKRPMKLRVQPFHEENLCLEYALTLRGPVENRSMDKTSSDWFKLPAKTGVALGCPAWQARQGRIA